MGATLRVGGDVAAVKAQCSPAETDESGVTQMDHRFVLDDDRGSPVAAAGYETWDNAVAHLGLAVAVGHRSQGLGAMVASAAALDALDHGLVLQWRSSETNPASRRTGERLGFVALGTQIAIELTGIAPSTEPAGPKAP